MWTLFMFVMTSHRRVGATRGQSRTLFFAQRCSHQYVALLVDVRFIVPSEAEVCTRLGMDVMGGD